MMTERHSTVIIDPKFDGGSHQKSPVFLSISISMLARFARFVGLKPFFGIVQLLAVSQHAGVFVFLFLYFVLLLMFFFCSIFSVLHKTGFWSSWLIH